MGLQKWDFTKLSFGVWAEKNWVLRNCKIHNQLEKQSTWSFDELVQWHFQRILESMSMEGLWLFFKTFLASMTLFFNWQVFKVNNITFYPSDDMQKKHGDVQSYINLGPNGKHRFIIRAYSAADDNVLTFVIFNTFKVNGNNWEY